MAGMNAVMKSFGFGEQLVRVIDRDDAPWFVASDVCASLEIANASHAVSRLDDDEKGVVNSDPLSPGGRQELRIISESGVYALIFTSRKPVAKKFRKWVTAEVLPAIRRDGRYEIVPEPGNDGVDLMERRDAPDDFDRDRLNVAKVREARLAFGAAAARRMWELSSLPDLTPPTGVPMLAPTMSAAIYQSVNRWLEERTEHVQGSRVSSTGLYGDYVRWCLPQERTEPVSLTAFGRYLSACGILSIRSNCVYRVGIRLKPPEPSG